jgi:hypothetical protein
MYRPGAKVAPAQLSSGANGRIIDLTAISSSDDEPESSLHPIQPVMNKEKRNTDVDGFDGASLAQVGVVVYPRSDLDETNTFKIPGENIVQKIIGEKRHDDGSPAYKVAFKDGHNEVVSQPHLSRCSEAVCRDFLFGKSQFTAQPSPATTKPLYLSVASLIFHLFLITFSLC